MRIPLRILFSLLILLGVLLAIVYPWSASQIGGYEIGRWTVYDAAGGWRPAEAQLSEADSPALLSVEMRVRREFQPQADRPILTITASANGKTVLAETMSFAEQPPTKSSPQASEATYREKPGSIATIAGGTYTFVVGTGEAEGVDIETVDLVVQAGSFDLDPRAQPIGFVMIVIGVIGLVLAMRRFTGTTPRNPNEKPPIKRWGRG